MAKETKLFQPEERNLGRSCIYWGGNEQGSINKPWCMLRGPTLVRDFCNGKVDEGCLFLRTQRTPQNPTNEMIRDLERRLPEYGEIYIALREKIRQQEDKEEKNE